MEEALAGNTPSITTKDEADEQKEDRCNSKLGTEKVEILGLLGLARHFPLAETAHLLASALHRLLYKCSGETG